MPDQFLKFEKLMGNSFKLMNFPMIHTENLEPEESSIKTLSKLSHYNWLVFTSMRGVSGFRHFIQKAQISSKEYRNIKTACIGKSTAIELRAIGIKPDYINPGNTSEEFAIYLQKDVLKPQDNVLLVLGEKADNQLEYNLCNYCLVDRINVYKTINIGGYDKNLETLINKDDYQIIIFTSPSGFESFLSIYKYKASDIQLKIASIGMKTTKAIEDLGFKVMLTAKISDLEGLAGEIKKKFETGN
jgi:uroporphyrinogen-III synthase